MEKGHGFNLLEHIPVINDLPNHVGSSLFVCLILIVSCFLAQRKLKIAVAQDKEGVIPDPKFTYLNVFEIFTEGFYHFIEEILGPKMAKRSFPFLGTLFLFVLVSNLLGTIPIFEPPTDNMNTTLGLGILIFLYYQIAGFAEHGISYCKQFFGPVLALAPLMLIIEVVSHLFRPFSLGLRLRTNIFADHLVLSTFSDLVPLGVPIAFYGLGLFVAIMQASVMTVLTVVYLSLAVSHDH